MDDVLQSERCAALLKVIADPERLKIVQCLRGGPRSVSEIAAELQQELANVSHHLCILREAGFLLSERRGRFIVYSLNPRFFVASKADAPADRIEFGCCRLDLPLSRVT